jgi:aminoglycoside 6'-N-acetyltransferase
MLTTARLFIRPLREDDLAALDAILREPEVARYWTSAARDLFAGGRETTVLAVTLRDSLEVVGAVQLDEPSDDDYPSAGVDLFLATRAQGQGLGQETLGAVVAHLFDVRKRHRITIDPLASNARAVRCYERAGFRHVGVMRRYQKMPDGRFEDGLLMELLADDVREHDVAFLLSRIAVMCRHEGIEWDASRGEAPLRRLLADPRLGRVHVLRDGGERVGYAIVTYGYDLEFGGRDAFLTELWVDPAARGKGIARRALEEIFEALRRDGAGALHLQVRPENEDARRLYAAAGFVGTTRVFLSRKLA